MATQVTEKIIRIDVVASANAQRTVTALAADMKKIESAASNMQKTVSGSFGGLETTFGKLASFFSAFGLTVGIGAMTRAVLDTATAYQVLEARMKLVLGTQERGESATARIIEIAKLTGREVDGVSKLYEKAARAAQQFGISEEKVSQITLGFAQSIRLSGASTQEAYASLVQFGQALASGRLQGDEFRSLMENNAVFMYEFAKAAGVTVSALRKMGTEGKLSAKFLFDTMAKEGADGLNMMQRLNKMAQDVPLTFSQSFNSLKTAAFETVGTLSKLFDAKTEDKLGLFGGWIRGLTEFNTQMKELERLSKALDLSKFQKIGEMMNVFNRSVLEAMASSNVPGVQALGVLGLMGQNKIAPVLPFAERLAQEVAASKASLEKSKKDLADAQSTADKLRAQGKALPFDASPEGLYLRGQKVREAQEALNRAQAELNSVRYGDRVDPNYGKAPPKAEATAEELRKAKAARDALEDFVQGQKQKLEASQMLLRGEEDRKVTAKALVELDEKLAAAGVKLNSGYAITARAIIHANEKMLDAIDTKKEFAKATTTETDAIAKNIEKTEELMARDEATIESLHTKTKASQEYTTALLKQQRALAERDVRSAKGSGMGVTDPSILASLEAYVAALDKAIAKRTELEEVQGAVKQDKAQKVVDEINERRIQNSANEINNALTQGLEKGNFGETFFKNIQETLKEKAIDVVVNPITYMFSRKLAEIADAFGTMLAQELAAAIANESSGDVLGSFIDNLSLFEGFRAPKLATGMSYVPYDEFPAILHKGERVMTAAENSEFSNRSSVVIHSNPVINIDSRTDQAQVYQIALEATQRGNVALVEELRAQGALA